MTRVADLLGVATVPDRRRGVAGLEGTVKPSDLIGRVFRTLDDIGPFPCPVCGLRIKAVLDITEDRDWGRSPACIRLLHVTSDLISHPGRANECYHVFECSTDGTMRYGDEQVVFDHAAETQRLADEAPLFASILEDAGKAVPA